MAVQVLKWHEHVGFKANQPCNNNRKVKEKVLATWPRMRCPFSCTPFSGGDLARQEMCVSPTIGETCNKYMNWPNFHAPSMSIVNLDEVNLLHLGHHPKMFLFLLEEMVYMYTHVGTDDIDGLWVMVYEVLTMVEMWYHLCKRSTNPQDMMQGDAMSCVVWVTSPD